MQLQQLAAIVDGSDDAIISKTLDGVVSTWNAAATRIFGYTAEEMVGRPIARIIPAELLADEAEILAKLARGERIEHFDTVRLAKDGRRVDVSLTVSPLRDPSGKVVGASKIARDITSRKEAEIALRQANETCRRLQMEAEQANRAKTDFLAVMSHEIRTPLNSIHGFIELLTSLTTLTPQQRRYADLVRTANAALLTIVDDILDFSKVEAGQIELNLQTFSLSKMIKDTIAIVAPAADAKNLRLSSDISPDAPEWVMGDEGRLRQIVLNLLNNAVKFTETGSISLAVIPQLSSNDGRLLFSVTDTGVGVPAHQQDRLFKEFSQADSSVGRKYGGTGLGLAISNRLVQLMDGEIGIVSEVDRGAIVWFTARLPAAIAPVRRTQRKSTRPNSRARNDRILVVDDIDTNLEIVEAYLRDSGYQIDCVTSGFDALQLLGSKHFDLVLMDVQMPQMDGVTATKRIRALPGPTRDVPIIAMTGNVLPHQVGAFLAAGMNDHVGKPIEREKLRRNIRRWLPSRDRPRTRAKSAPSHFHESTFDEFVLLVGEEKARQLIERYLDALSQAFQSTFSKSQKEAHDLLNVAGAVGLGSLVKACRQVADYAPSPESPDGSLVMQELLRAKSTACDLVINRLLPKLHKTQAPAMSRSQSDVGNYRL